MDTKTCSTCNKTLPIANFYKGRRYKDGYRGQCKACTYAKSKEYVSTEKGRQMAREATRAWRLRNLEKGKAIARRWYYERGGREYFRQYRLTEKGQKVERKAGQKYRAAGKCKPHEAAYKQRNPEKRQAKTAVAIAVRNGLIPHISTRACQWCGKQAHQHHHESYERDQWLVVIPLCRKCHATTYRKMIDH